MIFFFPILFLLFYLPGYSEVVLSLAAGPDNQVSLVQGLHHLLCLVEADVVEVWVGDHALDVRCRRRGDTGRSVSVCLNKMERKDIVTRTL